MPLPDFDAVYRNKRWNDDQLDYLAKGAGSESQYAQALQMRQWAATSPTAPAGVLQAFSQAGITPDSELGQWAIRTGVPALGVTNQKVQGSDVLTNVAASQLLGNPSALAAIKNMPLDAQTKLFQGKSVADVGAFIPQNSNDPEGQATLQRVLDAKSPQHHASFWEHVGSAISPVTQPLFGGLQAGAEAFSGQVRHAVAFEWQQGSDLAHGHIAKAFKENAQNIFATGDPGGGAIPGGVGALVHAKPVTPERREVTIPGTAAHIVAGGPASSDIPSQITLTHMLRGESAGQGIFPAGPAHEAAVKAQQAAASVNGHALTPGRAVAALVLQPGSRPYNIASGLVDLQVAMKVDPAAVALGEYGALRKAAKVVQPLDDSHIATVADRLLDAHPNSYPAMTQWAGGTGPDLRTSIIDKLREDPGSLQQLVKDGVLKQGDAAHAIGLSRFGAVQGMRNFLQPQNALQYLNSAHGDDVVKWIAKKGLNDIYGYTKGKLPAKLYAALHDATDPEEVRTILGDAMQHADVSRLPGSTLPYTWTRPLDTNRLTAYLPKGSINPDDADQALESARRHLGSTNLVPKSQWDSVLAPIAKAQTRAEMYDAYVHGLGDKLAEGVVRKNLPGHLALDDEGVLSRLDGAEVTTADTLAHENMNDLAERLTRFMPEATEADRTYAINELGTRLSNPGLVINGEPVAMDDPFLWSQMLNKGIPSLNVHEINRSVGMWGKLWNTPLLGPGVKATDNILNAGTALFKMGALFKLGLPARFLGDEQARMATMGVDSAFRHPLSYMAYVIGGGKEHDVEYLNQLLEHPVSAATRHPIKLGQELATRAAAPFAETLTFGKAGSGITGKFIDDFADKQSDWTRAIGSMQKESKSATASDAIFSKHHEAFTRPEPDEVLASAGRDDPKYRAAVRKYAAATEATHGIHAVNPASREVVKALLDPTYVPEGMLVGAGGGVERSGLDAVKDWNFEGAGSRHYDAQVKAGISAVGDGSREAADKYIDMVAQQLQQVTAGDPDLLKAIASGHPSAYVTEEGKSYASKVRELIPRRTGEFGEELPRLPPAMLGPKIQREAIQSGQLGRLAGRLDHGFDRVMGALMDAPSGTLTRSPAFRQSYWKRMDEMLPFMDAKTIAQAQHVAAAEGIQLRNITKGTGMLDSAEKADQLAKAHALAEVKQYLYYPGERSGIADKLRYVMPFGEAWKNVMTKWAQLTLEHPQVVRRVQQGVVDSRESGWWFTDPADGVEKFTMIPGEAMQSVTGAPFPMVGHVKGLSLIGTGMPGFGPGLQIPAGLFFERFHSNPIERSIRDFLNPYGAPDLSGGILESFAPGWSDKLRAVGYLAKIPGLGDIPESQTHGINSAKFQAVQYLTSSGKYDLTKAEDMRRLDHDSTSMATKLYFWRTLAQASLPAAPSYIPQTQLENGGTVETWLIAKDYKAMLAQNQGDSSKATLEFITKYGMQRIFSTEAMTRSAIYGLPTDAEGEVWAENHSNFAHEFNTVYGYWVPQGQDSKFDYQEYLRQIKDGDREAPKFDKWMKIGEARVGNAVYDELRRRLPASLNADGRAYLAQKKLEISKDFPGFNDDSIKLSRKSFDGPGGQIEELKAAVRDPAVSDTMLAHAATIYLSYRDHALEAARRGGLTTLSGQAAAPLRDKLFQLGDQIARDVPEFTTMWNNLLQHEVDPNA